MRLDHAIQKIDARRIAIDTLEAIFCNNYTEGVLRAEIQRLFRWIKERGMTAIVTGERGRDELTRHGLEEYISDCVISLDHRVSDQITTRRLRVVKYRGTVHGTNEYPFLVSANGISVLPITSLSLNHEVSSERISSGIPRLDTMLGGLGFYKGSSILISGTAGTGKSTIAGHFVRAACERNERCLYFAFEEAPAQIQRNLSSVGVDLHAPVSAGLLTFEANRPTATGLEAHLLLMLSAIEATKPSIVVVDPVNAFISGRNVFEVKQMLVRLIDFLKIRGITALFTSLTSGASPQEGTDTEVSSVIDTWLVLRDIETNGERNRGLIILKSRGMAHSNQIREFKLSSEGILLCDVFVGDEGVLMGTARLAKEAAETAAKRRRNQEIMRLEQLLEEKARAFDAQTQGLQATYDAERDQIRRTLDDLKQKELAKVRSHAAQAESRFADSAEV